IVLGAVVALVACGGQSPAAKTVETIAVKVAVATCEEAVAALQPPDPAFMPLVCQQLGGAAEGAINASATAPVTPSDASAPKVVVVVHRAYWQSLKSTPVDAGQ